VYVSSLSVRVKISFKTGGRAWNPPSACLVFFFCLCRRVLPSFQTTSLTFLLASSSPCSLFGLSNESMNAFWSWLILAGTREWVYACVHDCTDE